MRAVHVFAAAVFVAALSGSAAALRLPGAPRCPVFPQTNPWNRSIDKLPVAANSGTLIRSIGLDTGLHADFGSGTWDGGPIGIPFDMVTGNTPRARVLFEYADESDRVGYPIPRRFTSSTEATITRCWSIATPAASTSSAGSRARVVAGTPGPARRGACARTAFGRRPGRRPTPPASRSSRAWLAGTRRSAE